MLEKFERYPLMFGPTPIEKLDRLSEHLGGSIEIYAKREPGVASWNTSFPMQSRRTPTPW